MHAAALLYQPLLSGWYDGDSPQEQQAKRTGLLPSATTDEWFAMQCVVHGCSFRVEDDFCDEHGRGLRELFMCDACHKGSHYECVRRVGAIDELEGMLDGDEGWHCRAARDGCGSCIYTGAPIVLLDLAGLEMSG